MSQEFRRGERVEWNFRGRRVTGRVRRKLTARTEVAGRPVAASKDDPRYVVRTDRTGKETTRRPDALRRIGTRT
jgi:Hypervirulence associated proteins TUDOR domain